MREIKFRTFDKESKEYNNPYHSHWIYLNDPFKCEWFNDHFIIEQFTGLYDSEGNEIYEGDIVERDWMGGRQARVVTWNNEDSCFDSGSDYLGCDLEKNLKIIGNINENPELLK